MRVSRPLFLHMLFIVLLFIPSPRAAAADDVLRATLANGLRVVIVKNTLAPVVAAEVNYLVGSNEAPDGFPGMAHALEHMMFRGSPGMSAEQLANIMALLGGQFNAATQQTVTQYFFIVPRENLDVALQVEAQRMRGVLNTQELWEQERGAIEQEVAQDLSYPEYVLSTRMLAQLFAGTPYAHDALGTRPSFQRTTGAMLKEFSDKWYAPNNAILVIVGDVDPKRTLALEPKAAAVNGALLFAAQIPAQGSTTRALPASSSFQSALESQLLAQSPPPPAPPAYVPPTVPATPVVAQAKINLALPIAVGLGGVALGFMLWRKR